VGERLWIWMTVVALAFLHRHPGSHPEESVSAERVALHPRTSPPAEKPVPEISVVVFVKMTRELYKGNTRDAPSAPPYAFSTSAAFVAAFSASMRRRYIVSSCS